MVKLINEQLELMCDTVLLMMDECVLVLNVLNHTQLFRETTTH